MPETAEKFTSRINSVDLLRGLVMVIMVLDHVREFVHSETFLYSPTDLSKTSATIFFTRWITHFCAPVFVFLAGTSIYLQLLRGKSRSELARFLVTRGLWLILLEFTVVRFSIFFNIDYSFFGIAEVIWIFGVSMIFMAGLIYLPVSAVAACAVAMIALHNLLDRFSVPAAVAFAATPPPDALQKLWFFIHQPGVVPLFGDTKMFVAYPLIPWVGVMAAGYALGVVYSWEAEKRRKFLFRLGLGLTVFFIVLRAINIYGDPSPWSAQPSGLLTFLSFLNTTKYPVSLLFLLMTLGPALMLLAATDGIKKDGNLLNKILITFGRVPFFYFILQMFISHGAGVLLSYLAGKSTAYLFFNFPASATDAPPGAGFPMWVVYAAWIVSIAILYPICRWYSKLKEGRHGFPYSYL